MTHAPLKPLWYRKLLFPVDGFRDSHVAVPQVVSLALASGAGVIAVEVVESRAQVLGRGSAAGWLPLGDGYPTQENAQLLAEARRRAAADHLRALRAELERAGVARIECVVRSGRPGPLIVETAERSGCDAIVMATHGRSGLSRLLLGSVAEYLARHAPCPVLLVPVAPHLRKRRTVRSTQGRGAPSGRHSVRSGGGSCTPAASPDQDCPTPEREH